MWQLAAKELQEIFEVLVVCVADGDGVFLPFFADFEFEFQDEVFEFSVEVEVAAVLFAEDRSVDDFPTFARRASFDGSPTAQIDAVEKRRFKAVDNVKRGVAASRRRR